MSDFQPPAWVRSWATTLVTSSVFASFGVSVGGMLAVVAMMRGENPWPWFTAGSCIPPGIMALIYTTDSMFERRLRTMKRWKEEGIITAELYEEQLRQAMAWRASRLYGNTAKPASRPRPKPKSKAVEPPEPPAAEPTAQPAS